MKFVTYPLFAKKNTFNFAHTRFFQFNESLKIQSRNNKNTLVKKTKSILFERNANTNYSIFNSGYFELLLYFNVTLFHLFIIL